MSTPYLALRALVTGAGPYAGMTADAAEDALNAATVAQPGSALLKPDEFVDLFTPQEFVAIEDSPDANIRKLVFRLRTRQEPLDLASATVQQSLGYMAAIGLLTAERAAAIGAVPPGPTVTPAQAMGWPGGYVWAADVIAARAMEG
jgi:hypothetical protein